MKRTKKSLKIQQATSGGNLLSFKYCHQTAKGKVLKERTVEPFFQGLLHNGTEALRAYDTESKSWKIFKLSEIKNLSVDKKSEVSEREDYNPKDKDFGKKIESAEKKKNQ